MNHNDNAKHAKWKWQFPIFLLLGALLVIGMVRGLHYFEQISQKPRLIKALQLFFMDFKEEVSPYQMAGEVFRSGKVSHGGSLTVTYMDPSIISQVSQLGERIFPFGQQLSERFQVQSTEELVRRLVQGATIQYDIQQNQESRQLAWYLEYSLMKIPLMEFSGYMDDEELMVYVPQFNKNYLMIPTKNIKSHYEQSLLYTTFGSENMIPFPEQEYSLRIFPEEMDQNISNIGIEEWIKEFSHTYEAELLPWFEQIKVEKLPDSKENLAAVYQVLIPTDPVRIFYQDYFLPNLFDSLSQQSILNLIPAIETEDSTWILRNVIEENLKNGFHDFFLWEEELPVLIYLDDNKQIIRMEMDLMCAVGESSYPISLVISRKGQTQLSDFLELELSAVYQEQSYQILLQFEHLQPENERQQMNLSLYISKPYVSKIAEFHMECQPDTRETNITYMLKTPILTVNGEQNIVPLNQEITKQEFAIDLFHMEFLEMMQFIKELNGNILLH